MKKAYMCLLLSLMSVNSMRAVSPGAKLAIIVGGGLVLGGSVWAIWLRPLMNKKPEQSKPKPNVRSALSATSEASDATTPLKC